MKLKNYLNPYVKTTKLKAFSKYVESGKDVKSLSEEDQFLIAVI